MRSEEVIAQSPGESHGSQSSRESRDWTDWVLREKVDAASEEGLEQVDEILCQWSGMLRDLSRDRGRGERAWYGIRRGTPHTDS